MTNHLPAPGYTPNRLLNRAMELLNLKRDSHLAKRLGESTGTICRLRKGQRLFGAVTLLRIHEATGLTIHEMRALMGERPRA